MRKELKKAMDNLKDAEQLIKKVSNKELSDKARGKLTQVLESIVEDSDAIDSVVNMRG